MSHELRTPLTGLLGICDLLAADASLNEAQRRLCDLALDSGRVLLTIVNDILDFSAFEAGRIKLEAVVCNFRGLLGSCQALVAHEARRKGLDLRIRVASEVPDLIIGDPIRLRQILINLLGNAIKFTASGRVELVAALADDRRALKIVVEDTGIGIAPDRLPRLFERFSQADSSIARRFGGSGLGLAICRQIVTMMGGSIGAESTAGVGSTFWFEIPVTRAEAQTATAAPEEVSPPRRGLHLLLAEDNSINQQVIAAALRNKGHAVVAVADGAAAFAAFRGDRFDAILMDIQMPGTDGLAATRMIRGLEAQRGAEPTPIVALTANALGTEVDRCLAAGMNTHVAKPIVWASLFDTLGSLCPERSGAHAQVPGGDTAAGAAPQLFSLMGRRRIVDLMAAAPQNPGLDAEVQPEGKNARLPLDPSCEQLLGHLNGLTRQMLSLHRRDGRTEQDSAA